MCDILTCGSVCVKVNLDFCLCCSVDVLEIIPHMEFDIDSNGVVSEEEAKVDHSSINYISKSDYDFILYTIFYLSSTINLRYCALHVWTTLIFIKTIPSRVWNLTCCIVGMIFNLHDKSRHIGSTLIFYCQ